MKIKKISNLNNLNHTFKLTSDELKCSELLVCVVENKLKSEGPESFIIPTHGSIVNRLNEIKDELKLLEDVNTKLSDEIDGLKLRNLFVKDNKVGDEFVKLLSKPVEEYYDFLNKTVYIHDNLVTINNLIAMNLAN